MWPYGGVDDWFVISAAVIAALALVTILGLIVALIGWGGRRVGRAIGALIGLFGLAVLIALVFEWPRVWWWCVPPIYAGWLAVSAWRPEGEPRIRPLQFSLRGWMLFLLALSLTAGGAATNYQRHQEERRLIAQLDRGTIGVHRTVLGRINYVIIKAADEQEFNDAIAVLRQLGDLRHVQLDTGRKLPPRVTQQLGHLANLRTLSLQHLPIRDGDLEPLGRLKRLELLEVEASELTDAGLRYLYPLKRLRKVWLYNHDAATITPQGMQQLHAALPRLEN